MLNSGMGARQWGHGKLSSAVSVSAAEDSSSQSISDGAKEGGTSFPQTGQGRWPRRANSTLRYVYTSVEVPTVDRGLRLVRCWSTLMDGESPVMASTGGFA